MVVAIKGIIGSGKSTVSKIISEKYGFEIVDADKLVHEMYESDSDLIEKINSKFSLEGQSVDRKALGSIVFNDEEKLKDLEKITHPALSEKINQLIKENADVLVDCQVIDKLDVDYDYVIVVTAPRSEIVKRVMKRDQKSEELVNKIIDMQDVAYVLDKRTYTVDTVKDDVEEQVVKIIKGFNDCEKY